MTNSMHVAFSSDRNYLEYAAVALASLLHFASRPVTVHFLHEELTEADFERLKALPSQTEWELKPVRIPEGRFRDWPTMRWSRAAWYRLMAPELFPELDRLIYLDCDLIFVDDYLNVLSIGTAMKGSYDKKKVPREALAYLLDSTGAPVCVLIRQ